MSALERKEIHRVCIPLMVTFEPHDAAASIALSQGGDPFQFARVRVSGDDHPRLALDSVRLWLPGTSNQQVEYEARNDLESVRTGRFRLPWASAANVRFRRSETGEKATFTISVELNAERTVKAEPVARSTVAGDHSQLAEFLQAHPAAYVSPLEGDGYPGAAYRLAGHPPRLAQSLCLEVYDLDAGRWVERVAPSGVWWVLVGGAYVHEEREIRQQIQESARGAGCG